jgi:hypothetical protein
VRDVFCHNYVFVLTLIPPRSYIIQTDSGEIRRNRRHLVKIPESVKDNDKITSETAPDNSSKSDNENKDILDNR